ncbi:subclass B1 metallo-beta-lactamase [uncultured Tenacibaculum sp.]|uniref:subclass B1 metallo-beta-lactamase n=1 Tax=uncultured Tenacibaculum sp. TaxID=174713 RepID=UPI0026199833|nr:subclass B1 metallo-beta-lactamase [uncultured Tenacibaculum sp.]
MKNYFYRIGVILLFLITVSCKKEIDASNEVYSSETLKLKKLTDNVYVHTTFLDTESWGKVACNGMVVIDNNEAVVFDTPSKNKVAKELITWIENQKKATIIAVIPTHFHVDCLGSLEAFHHKEVPSYASLKTIKLAKEQGTIIPQHGFYNNFELKIGNNKIICEFLGEGHTKDNIIGYYSKDKVLFGGCLVKTLKAKKGNLADANVKEWSNTVNAVKGKYKDAKWVIPGHGNEGDTLLLNYTIALFKE